MNNPIDLLIIGAGPTGLTAAIEAVRHGLSVRIIDKNGARSPYSKALVAHARSMEIFRDLGIIDDILANGQIFTALNVYDHNKLMTRIVFEDLDWKDALYPFWLSIPQSETERCLEEKLNQLGVQVERNVELFAIEQHGEIVSATLQDADGCQTSVEASWMLGSDGARSTTRKLLNLQLEGQAEDEMFILADVNMASDLPEDEGYNILSNDGVVLIVPLPEPQSRRLIFHMPTLSVQDIPEMTLQNLQQLLDERTTLNITLTDVGWTSSFSVKHFVVSQHRVGRVFLAGDAAHIHSPVGGQGMNSGIQDAYNLVWKLALVHHGQAKPALLESYEVERHDVAENLIKRVSMATQIVTTHHPIGQFIRKQVGNILINTRRMQNQLGRNVAMLDINYAQSPIVYEAPSWQLPFERVIQVFGQNSHEFHQVAKAGHRAPNVLLHGDAAAMGLFDRFHGTHHTLLLFMGQGKPAPIKTLQSFASHVKSQFHTTIHPIIITNKDDSALEDVVLDVISDPDNRLHQAYGAKDACLYLIRPDFHIGYRNQHLQLDALTQYLDAIFV